MSPLRSIAIVLLLVGATAGCKRTDKGQPREVAPAKPSKPRIVVDDGTVWKRVEPSQVTRLEIEAPGAAPVVLVQGDGGWQLEAPVRDRADQRAVQFALNELRKLEWDAKPIASDAGEYDLHKIGPADAVTVRITEAGQLRPALVLGKRKSARIGDRAWVYRVHNLSYFTFARELRFWRDRTITRFAPDAVTRLEVRDSTSKRALVLSRTPPPPPAEGEAAAAGTWKVIEGGKVDLERAELVYRRLLDLEGADVAAVAAAAAGLETPRLSLVAHTAEGKTRIDIGGEAAGGGAYVRVHGSERILVLSPTAAAALAAPLAAWRKP